MASVASSRSLLVAERRVIELEHHTRHQSLSLNPYKGGQLWPLHTRRRTVLSHVYSSRLMTRNTCTQRRPTTMAGGAKQSNKASIDASTTYTNPFLSACKQQWFFALPRYQAPPNDPTAYTGQGRAFASSLVFPFILISDVARVLRNSFDLFFIAGFLRACCVQGFGWLGLDLML